MQFYRRSRTSPRRLGVLAGGFNPPTVAHLALAEASRPYVDEILYVLPRSFPHKDYFGASLEERLDMLGALELAIPQSVATSEQGLLIDIARECHAEFGRGTRLAFLCGRDAAERVLTWDYGREGVAEEMLNLFELLVASRTGEFVPPPAFQRRIHSLALPSGYDQVSSTDVRERIASGAAWEHLVPDSIVERVREIYS